MKHTLLLLVLLVCGTALGQEVTPSANNYSEISNNYKAQLGTGNFVFNVPLFQMETIDPDFTFEGNLNYNSQAASTTFTSEGILSRGWSVDFLPSIYRNINEENTLWDERYYLINTAPVYEDGSFTRPLRDKNDLFEFDVFGLRGSFRLVYNANNTITVKLVDCNGYVEISPVYSIVPNGLNGDGKIISLLSFSIKDKNGYSYVFNQAEESGLFQQLSEQYSILQDENWTGGKFNGYLLYKRAFFLGSVTDKYNRNLLTLTYKTYRKTLNYLNKSFGYDQKVIDKICITSKGCLTFGTTNSIINTIAVQTAAGEPVNNITLARSGVSFYNNANVLDKKYTFSYNLGSTDPGKINNYGNFLNTVNEKCLDPSLVYNNERQAYEAGLLKTVTLPYKGKVNVEYETNTYSFPGTYTILNALNYEYVQVPVTYNALAKTYSFFYDALSINNDEAYYLKFDSSLYTSPFANPDGTFSTFYPGLRIMKSGSLYQGFEFTDQCSMGQKIEKSKGTVTLDNSTVVLSQHQNLMDKISNVKVYKKRLKPENQRVDFLYGPSVRVKKITTVNENNVVVNEVSYGYQDINDPKKSSGKIADLLWNSYSRQNINSYKPYPIFYRYLTVEEPGKGKTVYELNTDQYSNSRVGVPEVAFQPKNIWKYNEANELQEEAGSTFEYFKVSDDDTARNKFKKVNSIVKNYEGLDFKSAATEKVFDEVSFEQLSNKITDESLNETFEEKYSSQKLGNAYYRTKVEKLKNNVLLNQSVFEYQPVAGSQAYNLVKVRTAKSTLPLETEKEITGYDDFGNITEYKTKDGTVVSQIWGYGNSKMVAELKNVAYTTIAAATITNIKNASVAIPYNETTLLNYLNGLRTSYPDGFITTYTYKPLIGISSTTDANGRKETYEYDGFNRLFRVLNQEGLITKEYNYNIKN